MRSLKGGIPILGRLYIGSFLAIAARYILVAVAPLIFVHWGASPAFAEILVGIAFLVQMIVSPIMGNLADKRGRRWSIVVGAVMMALGGAVVFVFPTIPGFVIGQVLFGVGPAAFFAAAFATVADVARKTESVVHRALRNYHQCCRSYRHADWSMARVFG